MELNVDVSKSVLQDINSNENSEKNCEDTYLEHSATMGIHVHEEEPDTWSDSSSSVHSFGSSRLDAIFEYDEVDEDDYVDKWYGESDMKTRPIFTVGNVNYGYEDSPEVKDMFNSATHSTHGSVPVKYFTHELSVRGRLRKFFIRNSTTRLACTFFDLGLKFIICLMYVVRVGLDNVADYECYGSPCGYIGNSTEKERDAMFKKMDVNWYVLIWIQRSTTLWVVEVTLASISLIKAFLMVYIATKGHRTDQVLTFQFFLEVICSVPMLVTLTYPVRLNDLWVPSFLNCWLAFYSLEKIYNDLHLTRQRFQTISVTLLQQMVLLVVNLVCLVFTNICFMQHLQRGSKDNRLSMFEAMYFVIVTFSTVGYGDISPDLWISQLFMILMICVAFASIPRQIEGLISTYMERQRAGGEYSRRAARRNKHVIVCSSTLTQDTLMDFLNEFYAHPKLEEHTVILLCSQELDSSKQVILKDPKWTHRVIYMKGSSLKDIDLKRSRVHQADACFFLAPRPTQDKAKADRHTILRSWAVKDFAPNCKQYIQLFSAANKIHVKFAEHVVCEDEFKYALLANNCLYPGLSTLVSLLVHTSTGQLISNIDWDKREGVMATEPWQQVYGRHSGNEIYHIQLQKSVFFSQYEGETFPRASADAHHRFGVALLAVLDSEAASPRLQLNPGPQYRLKGGDFCFYMSVTREEYSKISPEALKRVPRRYNENLEVPKTPTSGHAHLPKRGSSARFERYEQIALALQKYHNEHELTVTNEDPDESVFDTITSLMGNNITRMARKFTLASTQSSDNEDSVQDGKKGNGLINHSSSAPLLNKDESEKKDMKASGDEADGDNKTENELSASEDDKTADPDNIDHRHGAGRVFQFYTDMGQEKLTTGPPPVTIYSGSRRTNCHIMSEARQLCCLEWGTNCNHCTYKNAKDERWHHQLIILAAEHATSGIFNFIVPLRSSFIGVNGLSPIVLLLEDQPDSLFLDTIVLFPLVYYMIGSIRNVDDLLLAGINKASHLVVVNRDSDSDYGGEEILADSETIVAVQTIFKLFPNTYVVTELSQASNMRFMQFSAQDAYTQKASRLEQKLKDVMTTNLNHIFRLPFAAGQVFSASMLDTLLYQTFVKGYLISFVRLLLGIDAEEGSGHLSSIRVKRSTLHKFPEYGELYEGLCSATGEIPFAIYRTEKIPKTNSERKESYFGEKFSDIPHIHTERKHKNRLSRSRRPSHSGTTLAKSHSTISRHRFSLISKPDQGDLGGLIRNRLKSLDLIQSDYSAVRRRPNTLSYVITNPSPKRKLKIGDIIYVIQPSSMCAKPSKQRFFLHRSHSFGGAPTRPPKSSPSPKRTKATGSTKEIRVGRFKLRRFSSDKTTSRPRCPTVGDVDNPKNKNKF